MKGKRKDSEGERRERRGEREKDGRGGEETQSGARHNEASRFLCQRNRLITHTHTHAHTLARKDESLYVDRHS